MHGLELTPAAQQTISVVLIWIGFGAVGGVVARLFLPFRHPTSPAGTLVLGMAGSAAGLFVLSLIRGQDKVNPISPLGFLAAIGGALALLLVYQLGVAIMTRREDPPA